MFERCALSPSDLKIKFRTILLTSMKASNNNNLFSIPPNQGGKLSKRLDGNLPCDQRLYFDILM